MNPITPIVIQTSWVPAKVLASAWLAWSARSMRWIIARPIPFRAETMGSRIGSAYSAKSRIAMWQAVTSPASHAPPVARSKRRPAAPVHKAHQARRAGFAGAHGDSRHTAGVWVAEGEGEGVALGVGDGLAEAVGRGFFFPALAVAFLVGVGVGVGVGDGGQLTSVRRLLITARASVRLSALMPSLTCRARYGGRA